MRNFLDGSGHEPKFSMVEDDVILTKAFDIIVRGYRDILVWHAEFPHRCHSFGVLDSRSRHIGAFFGGEKTGRLCFVNHFGKVDGALVCGSAPPFASIEVSSMGACHEIICPSHGIIIANGREKENIPNEGMCSIGLPPNRETAGIGYVVVYVFDFVSHQVTKVIQRVIQRFAFF